MNSILKFAKLAMKHGYYVTLPAQNQITIVVNGHTIVTITAAGSTSSGIMYTMRREDVETGKVELYEGSTGQWTTLGYDETETKLLELITLVEAQHNGHL